MSVFAQLFTEVSRLFFTHARLYVNKTSHLHVSIRTYERNYTILYNRNVTCHMMYVRC